MAASKGEKTAKEGSPRTPVAGEPRTPIVPDLLRRMLALGFSGLFTTEEAFRRALGDTVPRDWLDFAVDQSERTRKEFLNRLAGEIARSLEAMDIDGLLRRLLAEHRIEVRAEIRLHREARGRRRPAAKIEVVGGGKTR